VHGNRDLQRKEKKHHSPPSFLSSFFDETRGAEKKKTGEESAWALSLLIGVGFILAERRVVHFYWRAVERVRCADAWGAGGLGLIFC
jgi:hypothetical protein